MELIDQMLNRANLEAMVSSLLAKVTDLTPGWRIKLELRLTSSDRSISSSPSLYNSSIN